MCVITSAATAATVGMYLSAASFAVAAAGTATTFAAQQSAANAESKYQNDQYKATVSSATQSYIEGTNSLLLQGDQQRAATIQEQAGISEQVTAAQSTVRTSAAAAGVSGHSVDAALAEFGSIEAENIATSQRNLKWGAQQRAAEIMGLHAQASGRISGAAPRPVAYPSAIALGLNIAGAGLDSYMQYRKSQPPRIK